MAVDGQLAQSIAATMVLDR